MIMITNKNISHDMYIIQPNSRITLMLESVIGENVLSDTLYLLLPPVTIIQNLSLDT